MTPYDASALRSTTAKSPLVDGFGRAVTYLRVSVTDRSDMQ